MMKLLSTRQYNTQVMAVKYSHGFTFIADQELDMIEDVINLSNKATAVWGCDQSFGASHAIAYMLQSIPETSDSYKNILPIFNKISNKEKTRDLSSYHYMSMERKREDLLEIQKQLKSLDRGDLMFYINALIVSDSIFSQIIKGKYYQSRSMREGYMRDRFVSEYKDALKTDTLPKVVLKFGHYHLMDGFNSGSNTLNVGNLTKNMATYNNTESLIINTQIYRDDNSDWAYLEEACPMFTKHAATANWTLFDLRPLRPLEDNGLLKGAVDKEHYDMWKDLLFKYDLLLIIGNGGDGTWNKTGVKY